MGRVALLAALAMSVAGCQGETQPFGFLKGKPGGDVTAGAAVPAATGERDVEAPGVFNLSEKGLWDGRPSLGGVWVAHGSVTEPQRVMIRNPENGRSVVGALFRREFDNPGPKLQVSSDAADALGMIAGQPQQLEVVALRREEVAAELPIADEPVPQVAEDAAKDAGAGPATAKGATIDLQPLEPVVATAAAALDKAEAAATTAAPARPVKPGKAQATPGAKVVVTPEGAAAAPNAKTPPAAAGGLGRAYVQIGIFSVEANAEKAAAQMKASGMPASVKRDQSNGKTFWRVIVGPAATEAERGALAAKVKGLGYPDAYPVSK
jgi:cell division septation protein DedD